MATIKKGKRKYTSTGYRYGQYEGEQYRGGRHTASLTKMVDGGYVNQFGVQFSEEDKRLLESRVNTANAKRNRMLKKESQQQLFFGGKAKKGAKVHDPFLDRESDFVIQQKSKSLQRFRSREDFDNYMENLARVNDRNYIKNRVILYKDNFAKALQNNGYPQDIIDSINAMTPTDFQEFATSEETANLTYIYDEELKGATITNLRNGIKAFYRNKEKRKLAMKGKGKTK